MQKTTIYLDERELKQLKILAAEHIEGSVAKLIRKAVRRFVSDISHQRELKFLKKILQSPPRKTSFRDGVRYQRSLRREW
ncbi:MAG: hypothetical protein HYU97_06855 [Deltaproteobacteria bacterium]|nr:hypothetical protein [Deltaproteobacteria bacterium]